MKRPRNRFDAVGAQSDSVGSGISARCALAGRVDAMGESIYHLTRTAPAA
ncbi:hypothetical protein [Halorussus marinus]|nr:hypothetical protein [Halorussus marinus]